VSWAWRAVRGGKPRKTTTPQETDPRPADLVERDFSAARPNQLWVSDFERHEVLFDRAVVKGHRLGLVAASH
jgi:hypothetical protein